MQRRNANINRPLIRAADLPLTLVQSAWHALQSRAAPEELHLLSDSSAAALKRCLLRRLTFTGEQAIDSIFSACQTTPLLPTHHEPDIARADCAKPLFCSGVEAAVASLFEHFPALEQLWSAQVANWLKFVSAFLRDANQFAGARLRSRNKNVRVIRAIVPDLADVRAGGRSVLRVRFARAEDWLYKPRPAAAEKWFFRLLTEANRLGFSRPFHLVDIVEGNGHHWMRFVRHQPCRNQREIEHFYHRAGGLLCLIHVLRGVDFHAGNLIAHGSQPVIVDCETLLHPSTRLPPGFALEERSVFRTGMLPIPGTISHAGDSVSALGRVTKGHQSVIRDGEVVSAGNYLSDLIAGFLEMHTLLTTRMADRSRLRRLLQRAPTPSCRVIRRPTATYYRILMRSVDPQNLRSASKRRSLLLRALRTSNRNASRVAQELTAVERAEIPVFRGRACQPRLLAPTELAEALHCIKAAFG
jgi:lantibiotic modifying enzyme